MEQLTSTGVQISKHSNLGEHYFENSIRKPFLCGLIKNIQDRFDDNSVMAAFDVFNPPKLSHQPTTEELTGFGQYGNKEIENHAKQFDKVIDDSLECVEEWASYRQYLKDNYSQRKHRDVISDLCSSTSPASIVYPNMSVIAKICRVIPIHTADVERTFSQLKMIKTGIRNRMCEQTLDALLRIVTEGPCLEDYPISEAVNLWAKKKNRRLST